MIDILPKEKETNLQELEKAIRNIQLTGVEWKAGIFHKHVFILVARTEDIAFGLKKLQIMALIVDQMVRMEDLEERILGLKDLVKSMEVVAWNKV